MENEEGKEPPEAIDLLAQSTFTMSTSKQNWVQANCCFICQKIFKTLTRRHHCRIWGHSVCDAHSRSRRQLSGEVNPVRVCDQCNRDAAESEDAAGQDLERQLQEINQQIRELRQESEELERTNTNQISQITNLEREIVRVETIGEQKKRNLEEKLEEEQRKTEAAQKVNESIRQAYQDQMKTFKDMDQKYNALDQEGDDIQNELNEIRFKNQELEDEIEVSKQQKKSKIPLDDTFAELCKPCRQIVFNTMKPKGEDNETLQEHQLRYSLYKSTFHGSTNRTVSNATDSCNCVIM